MQLVLYFRRIALRNLCPIKHLRVPFSVQLKKRDDDGKVFPFHFFYFHKMSPTKKTLVIVASSTKETQIETDIKVLAARLLLGSLMCFDRETW